MEAPAHQVSFVCDGQPVAVECSPGESLLSVLRERLGVTSVKDGCAPQGQCGCCTVLVDGEARVACVTPVERVAGRAVTTLSGLDPAQCNRLVEAFVAIGGSQCGFCTPGIVVRAAALLAKGRTGRTDVDRALAAHLCRCTGWQTVYEAIAAAADPDRPRDDTASRSLDDAGRQSVLESASPQHVGVDVPTGAAGFADDTAPRDALVAVPLPPGVEPGAVGAREVDGRWWVVGPSLADARAQAEKIQGRRTTVGEQPPLAVPVVEAPDHAVRLATGWVEPAYLEPDASWCLPGGVPASPLANGGAFGAKSASLAPAVARALADQTGRAVRVVYSREDTVRLGPKRPPIAAVAWLDGTTVRIRGVVANADWSERHAAPDVAPDAGPGVSLDAQWTTVAVPGPPVGDARAVRWGEEAVLVAAALDAAGVELAGPLDARVVAPSGAMADARVRIDPATGAVAGVEVRVDAGQVLDAVVLRSYCIGAAHMALGWVCTEGLAVDPESGEVLDLTIRSFGIIRPAKMPPVEVTMEPSARDAVPGASDAVFAAVAAAAWNAITRAEGTRPESWPAATTRAARALRR